MCCSEHTFQDRKECECACRESLGRKNCSGSGFVGTRLIDLLRESDGYELKNIDKQPSHFFSDVTVTGDVRDREKLTELLKGTDVVVLLAAEHRDDASPLSLYYEVNVGGMQNALAVMEANGIKRIVFTSSVAVYGLNKKNPNEEHPKDPFNHYGKNKWLAEMDWKNGTGFIRTGVSVSCLRQ